MDLSSATGDLGKPPLRPGSDVFMVCTFPVNGIKAQYAKVMSARVGNYVFPLHGFAVNARHVLLIAGKPPVEDVDIDSPICIIFPVAACGRPLCWPAGLAFLDSCSVFEITSRLQTEQCRSGSDKEGCGNKEEQRRRNVERRSGTHRVFYRSNLRWRNNNAAAHRVAGSAAGAGYR